MTKLKSQRDFTRGKLFFPMLLFTLPIMASSILQTLYNEADKIVVGQFSGDANALGAIGSTGSLTSLFVALAVGLSVGAGVVVAQRFGAHEERPLSRAVHTVFVVGAVAGVTVGLLGVLLSRSVLGWMETPSDIIDAAALYMRIIFLGMPAQILYNFGAAVLRSVGNSKTPLIILALTGLLNVGLNLVFVIGLHMSVEGVAYATIVAQYVSAVAVWTVLARRADSVRFRFSSICVDRRVLRDVLRIGIPSGVQSSVFSIANVLLQSAVNTFPTTTVSGNAVGMSMESITYVAMNSFYQTVMTVTGQNVGARRPDRVRRALGYALVQVVAVGLLISNICLFFADEILSLFVDATLPEAPLIIAAAKERNSVVLSFYFFCGIMEVLTGHLRGRGCSITPMISSLVCSCFLRVMWVWLVFPMNRTLPFLFLCFPISWVLTNFAHLATALVLMRREKRKAKKET